MLVSELIEQLQKLPQDATIKVLTDNSGDYADYTDVCLEYETPKELYKDDANSFILS